MGLASAPLLPVALALGIGIAGGARLDAPAALLVEATAVLLLLAVLAIGRTRCRLAVIALLPAVAGVGALRAMGPPLPAEHIARLLVPPVVAIEGRLAEEPARFAPDRMRMLLDVDGYHAGLERAPATGRVQVTVYGESEPVGEGQRVRALARLHRPVGYRNPASFDYPAHLRREGILLVGNVRGEDLAALGPDEPPWPVAVRRWAVRAIRSQLPESSAALLAGLLLGERAALPRETDESFRRAGVYHLLAVSGFNVALIASSVFGVLALIGTPRRAAALTAAGVVVGFSLVVGGQPSVLRATVMGLILLGGVLLDRESHPVNALCLSAVALMLWRPPDLWDPGFQLSFAATAGIVYLAAPFTAFLAERGWPRWLAAAVGVSLAAQLPVTPVMLAHFNQLSLIGIAANLFVVPLAGPATMLGMLALLVELVSATAAGLVFNAVWLLLVGLRGAVWAAAAVPAAMVHLPAPPWGAIVAWLGALVLLPRLGARGWPRAAAPALLVTALVLSAWPWLRPGDGRLRVVFLDVGQGDATYIELPGGERVLIDGGPGGARRFDVGERVLSPFLWNRPARRLDVVALSHADMDHAGGLGAVLRHFAVGEFWESGRWPAAGGETLLALQRSGTPRRALRTDQRVRIGDAVFSVLNPDGRPGYGLNDDSLVLRLDWRGFSVLLTGDLGALGEARVLDRGDVPRVLALRVAHHGSRSSSGPAFLRAARPAFAVISAGARNPFRHPAPETLARLEAVGARVYRTDRDGAVLFETDGSTLWVTRWARGDTAVFDLGPERAPPAAAFALPLPGADDGAATPAPPTGDTTASGSAGGRGGTRGARERAQAPRLFS